MLVLSRKLGEQIRIGSGITLTVLEVQGQRVKLGVDAPRECRVLRGELNQRSGVPVADEAPARERESAPVRDSARQRLVVWAQVERDAFELATSH